MKWIVIFGFAFAVCGLALTFLPGVARMGTNIAGLPITVTMVLFIGAIVMGHRLTSK